MKKRILSLFLVLSMLVGMLSVMPISVGAEEEITYDIEIENVDDWMALCGTTVDQKNVIVKAETLDFSEETDISPIKFSNGVFEGSGVVITGVDMENGGDAGLFCSVSGATIKNIVIENSSFVVTTNWAGALACCIQDSTVENIYVEDTVSVGSATGYTGGIIGGAFGGSNTVYITACVFEGTVTSDSTGNGGIVGNGNSSDNKNHTFVIDRCLVTGRVPNDQDHSCGFVGHNNKGNLILTNCIYAGGAEDDYFYNRPFFTNTPDCSVTNCYTTYTAKNGVYNNTKWDAEGSGVTLVEESNLKGLNPVIQIDGWTYRDGAIMIPDPNYQPVNLRGEGTEESPYLIGSAEEWAVFEILSENGEDFDGEYVALEADIDFDGATLHPVFCEMCGSTVGFKGTFDGKGKTLSNFIINSQEDSASLFGLLDGSATVRNLVVKNANIDVNNYGAVIAGGAKGNATIENIYVANDVTITGDDYIGGIVGATYSAATGLTVRNCVFTGTIVATGDYVAGIVGAARTAEISYCLNTGDVSATTVVAGIATAEKSLTISNCVNTGTITAKGSYWGDIYAGNPKDVNISISDCYYVDSLMRTNSAGGGTVSNTNNIRAELTDLIGLDATVPEGFTKREGDIAVPTAVASLVPTLLTARLYDGASVRLDTPTGLRFQAIIGASFLNSIKNDPANAEKSVTYGIIIAPTDYIEEADGTFTVAALSELAYDVSYVLIPAQKLVSGGDDAGYYEFTGVLGPVNPDNYSRAFSARAYIAVDGEIVYYSAYDSAVNSRSIAEVAEAAYEDTKTEQDDEYKYEIAVDAGIYSPYTTTQRETLYSFYGEGTPATVNFMSYNIRNVEGGYKTASNDPLTFEYEGRQNAVVDYILSKNPDVIGIQEASKKKMITF